MRDDRRGTVDRSVMVNMGCTVNFASVGVVCVWGEGEGGSGQVGGGVF
jgi:hypothetical protein